MDAQRLKIHLSAALRYTEIRKAIGSIEGLVYSYTALEDLPETSLLLVRDYLVHNLKDRTGGIAGLERAYLALVDEHLEGARRTERRSDRRIRGIEIVTNRGRPRKDKDARD